MKLSDFKLLIFGSQLDTERILKHLRLDYKHKKRKRFMMLLHHSMPKKNVKQSQLKSYRNTVKQIVKKVNFA